MEESDPNNSPSEGDTGVPVRFDQNHREDSDITFSETELAKYVVNEATMSAQRTLLVESVQEASLASVSSQDVAAAAINPQVSSFSLELARTVVIDVIFDHGRHRHFHHTRRKVVDKIKEGPSHHTPGSQKGDDLNLVDGLDKEKGHHGHDSSDVKGSSINAGTKFTPATMTEASDPYAEQAKDLVDNVISNAKEMVDDVIASAFRRLETRMSEREKTCESLKMGVMSTENTFISRDEDYEIQNIGWLTIQEFTVERAEEKINEYIQTWEYENSWLYCVDFLGKDTYPYDKRYRFRVRWSIPTRRKPVPRATASVYFTFVVSTIKPRNYPVDVFYVFETNRLVHKPGESRFREKWLKDIIESKVSMMAAVRF